MTEYKTLSDLQTIKLNGGHRNVRLTANQVYQFLKPQFFTTYLEEENSILIFTYEHGIIFQADDISVEEIEIKYQKDVILLEKTGGEVVKC